MDNFPNSDQWWDEFRAMNPDIHFESVSITSGGAQGHIYSNREQQLAAEVERLKIALSELINVVEAYFTGTHTPLRDVLAAISKVKQVLRGNRATQAGDMVSVDPTD